MPFKSKLSKSQLTVARNLNFRWQLQWREKSLAQSYNAIKANPLPKWLMKNTKENSSKTCFHFWNDCQWIMCWKCLWTCTTDQWRLLNNLKLFWNIQLITQLYKGMSSTRRIVVTTYPTTKNDYYYSYNYITSLKNELFYIRHLGRSFVLNKRHKINTVSEWNIPVSSVNAKRF